MLPRFAVIGAPIAHSLSPMIHKAFAHQTQRALAYETIEGHDQTFEQQVVDFFASGGKGLNCTAPFKLRAYAMADVVSEACQKAGAANTLWMQDKQLHADNTDGLGLVRDLARYMQIQGQRILILGSGGATRGIIYPLLHEKPKQVTVANRSIKPLEQLHHAFTEIHTQPLSHLSGAFDLIINATSATFLEDKPILANEFVQKAEFCYDLAYGYKASTPFVAYSQRLGCPATDGLGMLIEQAAASFCLWHGVSLEPEHIHTVRKELDLLRGYHKSNVHSID